MRTDLPRLMRERGLDAIVVSGPDGMASANPAFNYLIAPARDINGMLIVKASGETILVHRTMERDEAAHSGHRLVNADAYDRPAILREMQGDRLAAEIELLRRVFADLGVAGRVGFYGAEQQNKALAFLDRLRRLEICEVVAEYENDVIGAARETKDAGEAQAIRAACALTDDVIGLTRDYVRRHRVSNDVLLKPDGTPLTIGDVKRFFRLRCAEMDVEEDHTIFAIGRDAGVPHSRGRAGDPLRLGQTIVFDIFPRHHGYYADITRTWCLGYAPDHVVEAHAQVMQVHDAVERAFKAGTPTHTYMDLACRMFESFGHPSLRQGGALSQGFMHGLGHGFGLSVHEAPHMGIKGLRPDELIQPGTILCNEPGVYYPDDPRGGWGVRVEDDYWFDLDGTCLRLTEADRSLVVPMTA